MDALLELLKGYKYEALLQMSEANGLASTSPRHQRLTKQALIEALHERLSSPEHASETLHKLGPLERSVLERLLMRSGDLPTAVLREELQREDIAQPGPRKGAGDLYEGTATEPSKNYVEDILARLTLHGLVLSSGQPQRWMANTKLGLSPGLILSVPEPLRSHLPKPPLPLVDWGRGNLPAPIEKGNTLVAQRDLFIYWSYVRAQPLVLTQAGLLQKRTMRAISEQLLMPEHPLGEAGTETDLPKLHFWRLVLQELGLLVEERGQLRSAGPRNRVPEAWRRSSLERTKLCLEAWTRMKDWSELASLNVSTVSFDLPQARSVVLEQLRILPPGTWISAERFLNRLAIIAPRLLFQGKESPAGSSTQASDMYHADMAYAARTSRWFAEVEATFVGGALSGPLHWLGLLDISADEGRLLAFRINAGGARALDVETLLPAEIDEPRLVVQPNFQIFALGGVTEETLTYLEMFAERVKADRSAFEYTLRRETVYRAQKDGLSVSNIVAFLQQTCSSPVPQNVLRTLQEWGQQHERIVFHRNVALCQSSSADTMKHLWADVSLSGHLERALTAEVAVIKRGHAAALQDTLLQRGILAALSPKDDPCTGRLTITAAGEIQPMHEGPDLLLQSCVLDLAEERDGMFYVTEVAVNKALQAGMTLSTYLQRLETLLHAPLPADLVAHIKAWGRYYGQASLRKAVLLEVRDAATADELLADAALAPLLSRLAAGPRANMLLVHTEDLDELRRLLHERGVEIS